MPTQGRISRLAAFGDLLGDMRVGEMGAGHADHVELAADDRVAGGGDVLDAGGVEGRHPRLRPHFAGEVEMGRRALAHTGDYVTQGFVGVDVAADHVEEVDQARTREPFGDFEPLVAGKAALKILVADEPRADEEIRADPPPRGFEHGHAETQAVVERTAVFVGALVGGGRPELVDQMAVALELESVEAGRLHPFGRVGVGRDHTRKIPVLHRLGKGAVGGFAHARGRNHGQPIGPAPAGAAAEMGDLDHHRRPLLVHVVGELFQPRHALVLVEEDVAESLRAVGGDDRRAADHGERNAALGLFRVIEAVALLGQAVLGKGRLVRRRHEAVAQGKMPQPVGLEERIVGHGLQLSGGACARSIGRLGSASRKLARGKKAEGEHGPAPDSTKERGFAR